MATLFDITGEYLRLYELMASEDGADEEAIKDTLESLNFDLAEKSKGYAFIIKQLEADADNLDVFIKELQHKKEVRQNNAKRMKEAVLNAMDIAGITELPAGPYTIKIAKNGGKAPLEIPDESLVPERFMKIKYEPDKELIRKTIEDGTDLPFAEIKERGRHLTIK